MSLNATRQIEQEARPPGPVDTAQLEPIAFRWLEQVDAGLGTQVVALMRETSATAPIIGFATDISDGEAAGYLEELRGQLAAGKCRLLTIWSGQLLIGLCTLRRNLNPNNRHIADLAKGMIREGFRGGTVLPAAFHEIALACEREGVDLLTLDVRAGTPALRAWERFGFATYGLLPDYARAGGKSHAGHFMMQRVADLKANALAVLATRSTAAGQS